MSVAGYAHLALQALATSFAGGLCYTFPRFVVLWAWADSRPAETWPALQRAATRAAVIFFVVILAAIW